MSFLTLFFLHGILKLNNKASVATEDNQGWPSPGNYFVLASERDCFVCLFVYNLFNTYRQIACHGFYLVLILINTNLVCIFYFDKSLCKCILFLVIYDSFEKESDIKTKCSHILLPVSWIPLYIASLIRKRFVQPCPSYPWDVSDVCANSDHIWKGNNHLLCARKPQYIMGTVSKGYTCCGLDLFPVCGNSDVWKPNQLCHLNQKTLWDWKMLRLARFILTDRQGGKLNLSSLGFFHRQTRFIIFPKMSY